MSRSILKSWWDTVKQVNITKESNCDLHSMRLKLRAIMGFIILHVVVLYCTNNCLILVFILPVAGHQVNDFIQHCPLRWQLVPIMVFFRRQVFAIDFINGHLHVTNWIVLKKFTNHEKDKTSLDLYHIS